MVYTNGSSLWLPEVRGHGSSCSLRLDCKPINQSDFFLGSFEKEGKRKLTQHPVTACCSSPSNSDLLGFGWLEQSHWVVKLGTILFKLYCYNCVLERTFRYTRVPWHPQPTEAIHISGVFMWILQLHLNCGERRSILGPFDGVRDICILNLDK